MEHVKPPYADITAIRNGKKAVEVIRCPIIFNENSLGFEFVGAENVRIISIKYNWPKMLADLNKATKLRAQNEKLIRNNLELNSQLEVNGAIFDKAYYHKKSKNQTIQKSLNTRKAHLI